MTDTYLTDVVRQAAGRECSRAVSYPIEASDIRKWALAAYWPERPPQFLIDAEVAPEDFDPFAWGPASYESLLPDDDGSVIVRHGINERALGFPEWKFRAGLNGGMNCTYGVRMHVGDVITDTKSCGEYTERQGRNGLMLITQSISTWTNQRGELVKRTINSGIRF
ncbi:MAG: MaoC family dehydratase N-terminal domain-containing protein [Candidatus Nanopelagicales bacterium]|nr:MaoC family dehydratase N-terminal domain-containing protein [Candidatus Nanopelagicales bacterium]